MRVIVNKQGQQVGVVNYLSNGNTVFEIFGFSTGWVFQGSTNIVVPKAYKNQEGEEKTSWKKIGETQTIDNKTIIVLYLFNQEFEIVDVNDELQQTQQPQPQPQQTTTTTAPTEFKEGNKLPF